MSPTLVHLKQTTLYCHTKNDLKKVQFIFNKAFWPTMEKMVKNSSWG